jgi:hypothetical protein
MKRLDELEGAGVPATRSEAAELARTDPDRFNDLWESGALGEAMKTTETEGN